MARKQPMTADGRPIIVPPKRHLCDRVNAEAWSILHGGKIAGRIVIHYSRGGTATAMVQIHAGPLAIRAAVILTARLLQDCDPMHIEWAEGSAGGGGYDKASAAIAHALHKVQSGNPAIAALPDLSGRGMGTVERVFSEHGYTLARVI